MSDANSSSVKKFKMRSVVTVTNTGTKTSSLKQPVKVDASQWKTVASTAIKPTAAAGESAAMPRIPLNRVKLNKGMTPRTSVQAAPLSGQQRSSIQKILLSGRRPASGRKNTVKVIDDANVIFSKVKSKAEGINSSGEK